MAGDKPTTDPVKRSVLDNFKWFIEKFSLPLVLAFMAWYLPYQAKQDSERAIAAANERSREENKLRLYSDLLNKREDADSAVRRDVFNKLMDRYMAQGPADLDQKLVQLELLALNFHDALNVSPLFWQLDRQVAEAPPGERETHRQQLNRVAQGVKDRQMALLSPEDMLSAQVVELAQVPNVALPGQGCIGVDALTRAPQEPRPITVRASYSETYAQGVPSLHLRGFSIDVICRDPLQRSLYVMVRDDESGHTWPFWVDPYDFPLSNFTQLSRDERFALMLDFYDDGHGLAKMRLAYFPATRSGAKDKPHVLEIMSRLAATLPAAPLEMQAPAAGPDKAAASAPAR